MLPGLWAHPVVDVVFPPLLIAPATVVETRLAFVTPYIAPPIGIEQSGAAAVPSVA